MNKQALVIETDTVPVVGLANQVCYNNKDKGVFAKCKSMYATYSLTGLSRFVFTF